MAGMSSRRLGLGESFVFLLIIGLHVLLVVILNARKHGRSVEQIADDFVLRFYPDTSTPPVKPPVHEKRVSNKLAPDSDKRRPNQPGNSHKASTPPEMIKEPPENLDLPSLPPAVTINKSLVDTLVKQAVAADAEAQKYERKLLTLPHENFQSKFDKGMAAAEKGGYGRSVDITLPDGRVISKVFSIIGTYCVEIKNGDSGVRRTVITTCPIDIP